MPKVLMLLSNPFRPDVRVYKEAKTLMENGYMVEIIAWDRDAQRPARENVEGIDIKRTGPKAYYGSWLSHVLKLPRFWWRCFREAARDDFDVLHVHDLDTLPPGVLISSLKQKPLIYDAHESYGMMIEGSGASKQVGKLVDRFELFLVPKTKNVILVNPNPYVYRGIYPAIKNKKIKEPILIMNCKELSDPLPPPPKQGFRIGYVGALEPGRLLIETVKAVGTIPGIRFEIGGFGSLKDELLMHANKHQHISLRGEIKLEKLRDFYSKCHIVLSLVDPKFEHEWVGFPNRLFDAMALGRALMVSKGSFAAEQIVKKWECGLAVEPTEAGIRKGILSLKDNIDKVEEMGRNGRRAFEEKYNWDIQKRGLVEIYNKL